MTTISNIARLDAGESVAFLRQLEDIDKRAYMKRFPALIARQVIPSYGSVAEWAAAVTWREYDQNGQAKVIHNAADDLPMVDVSGQEYSQIIKDVGASYGYTIKEIKHSVATGVPLDQMRAETARGTCEQLTDSLLALGSATHGLRGMLALDAAQIPVAQRVGSYTLGTKAVGGVSWGTLLAPKATGQEIANDLIGMASKLVEDTKGTWSQFRIVLPIEQYNVANATRLNAINDTTALQYALKSAFIESITPWYMCSTAGAGSTSRIMAFAGDSQVLGAIVPQEWTPMAPQLRNMKYVVNTTMSCGGVVCRYPVACRYADGA